jgi:hypothetical protein
MATVTLDWSPLDWSPLDWSQCPAVESIPGKDWLHQRSFVVFHKVLRHDKELPICSGRESEPSSVSIAGEMTIRNFIRSAFKENNQWGCAALLIAS